MKNDVLINILTFAGFNCKELERTTLRSDAPAIQISKEGKEAIMYAERIPDEALAKNVIEFAKTLCVAGPITAANLQVWYTVKGMLMVGLMKAGNYNDIPVQHVYDMQKYLYMYINEPEFTCAVRITDVWLAVWNVSFEDALAAAEANACYAYEIRKLSDVDSSIISSICDMDVITSSTPTKVAAMGFNKKILKEVAKNNNRDLVIIPFSDWNSIVHPVTGVEKEQLKYAVSNDKDYFNPDGLALSKNIYFYNKDRDLLEVI